jgi:hypothetical protein
MTTFFMNKNAVISECNLVRKAICLSSKLDVCLFNSWEAFLEDKNHYHSVLIDYEIIENQKILRDIITKNILSNIIVLYELDCKFNHPQIKTISKKDDIIEKLQIFSMNNDLDALLLNCGCNSKLLGYEYIKSSLIVMLNNDVRYITKEIYPLVAKKHQTSICNVERSIRSAIENTYSNLKFNHETYHYFTKDRPSNYMYLKFLKKKILESKSQL